MIPDSSRFHQFQFINLFDCSFNENLRFAGPGRAQRAGSPPFLPSTNQVPPLHRSQARSQWISATFRFLRGGRGKLGALDGPSFMTIYDNSRAVCGAHCGKGRLFFTSLHRQICVFGIEVGFRRLKKWGQLPPNLCCLMFLRWGLSRRSIGRVAPIVSSQCSLLLSSFFL